MSDHVDSVKGYVQLMERWRSGAVAKGDDKQVAVYDTRLNFLRDRRPPWGRRCVP